MVASFKSEESNVYDDLVSHLTRTVHSIDETMHLLSSIYQAGTQNAAFVKARHGLFCELKLYGEIIHPCAIDVVTGVKQTTETLSQASNRSEIGEILPFVIRDCDKSLRILRTLPVKYAQVLENMEDLKEEIVFAMAVETQRENEQRIAVD